MHHLFGAKPHRYEEAEAVPWDRFLEDAATGDIIMHHGTGKNSLMMQRTMQCYYSHTAMLIVQPSPDVLHVYGLQLADKDPRGMYVWESTAQENAGARIVPWDRWIRHEASRNGEGYILMWRQLTGLEPRMISLVLDKVKGMQGTPYETHQLEMFKALGGLNRHDHVDSVFCSEMVAYAWKQAGLLDGECIASNMTTAKFSYYYGGNRRIDSHLTTGALLPEKRVLVPPELRASTEPGTSPEA
jgi:hypothetical protein